MIITKSISILKYFILLGFFLEFYINIFFLIFKNRKKVKLPQKAELLKQKANSSFEEQNYLEAIEFYNEAIQIAPDSPILYGNRAAALMKRNW